MKGNFTEEVTIESIYSFDDMVSNQGIYKPVGYNPDIRIVSFGRKDMFFTLTQDCPIITPFTRKNNSGWSTYKFVLSDSTVTIKN